MFRQSERESGIKTRGVASGVQLPFAWQCCMCEANVDGTCSTSKNASRDRRRSIMSAQRRVEDRVDSTSRRQDVSVLSSRFAQ